MASFNFFFISLLFLLYTSNADDITCYLEGECIESQLVDIAFGVNGALECARKCSGPQGCNYFTHHVSDQTCLMFADCPVLDPTACPEGECVSGRADCECYTVGRCQGTYLGISESEDEFTCLEVCRSDPLCTWVSFHRPTGSCVRMEDCQEIDPGEQDYITASKVICDTTVFGKVLVVGGRGQSTVVRETTEIVLLSYYTETCPSPGNLTFVDGGNAAMVGTVWEGEPMICGGESPRTRDCYTYNFTTDTWRDASIGLRRERGSATSQMLENNTFLVIGGCCDYAEDSSESLSSDPGYFVDGPDLRYESDDHCTVPFNSSHLFVVRYTSYYLMDLLTGEWNQIPGPGHARDYSSCGLINGGAEIVVAGGCCYSDSTHIVEVETLEWREGPQLPYAVSNGATVQFPETFLIFGGRNTGHPHLTSILEFDPINYDWIVRPEKMETGRYDHVAIRLPEDNVEICDRKG